MAIGAAGATNAALFAVQILSTADRALAQRMVEHKQQLARGVREKNARLQERLNGE
jgi:phosphoribosylcarboxyaminoimidazole (NCAIR) mutase